MSPRILGITEVRFYRHQGEVPEGGKILRESERDLFYELFHNTKSERGFGPFFTEKWWNEFGPDDDRVVAARVDIS